MGWGTTPSKCLVNKDIAPLTEPSYDCLSSSTLPAEHGPHCLPYCNTKKNPTLYSSFPSWLAFKMKGLWMGSAGTSLFP